MKRRDVWILLGVLAVAAALLVLTRLPKGGDGMRVTVYAGDAVYASVPADAYQEITVDQGDGRVNVVAITAEGVSMHSSTCKNQLCVKQGTLTPGHTEGLALGNWIICLSNGVSVELADADTEVVGK